MARRYDKEIREFLKVYQEELIENVCQLVRIPSVAGEKEGTHRYGVECAKALEFCMRLAKEKGITTMAIVNVVGSSICMKNQEKNACF